jgi:hypothetical protein
VSGVSDERLRAALLELGLEDWIPIPEALSTPEVVDVVGGGDAVAAVRRALQALVESGEVVLYRGHWEADPQPVPPAEALVLLEDPAWFAFHLEDPDEQRLSFVNVENVGS